MKRLGLHTEILPAISQALEAQGESHPYGDTDGFFDQVEFLRSTTIFDCRSLDAEFVKDTGAAARHEMEETGALVRLPFSSCYFEFSGGVAVAAGEIDMADGDKSWGTSVEYRTYFGWSIWEETGGISCPEARFPNGVPWDFESDDPEPFWHLVNGGNNPVDDMMADQGGDHLLGVLSLLSEKLLASEFRPDPEPALTRARSKRGRAPLSADSYVLTLNLAAVRAATRPPSTRSHESPRLHWRRGHWRALHRGSEFESKAWVRRCLVGDPTRGAIHKDYRLAWRQPLLSESAGIQ